MEILCVVLMCFFFFSTSRSYNFVLFIFWITHCIDCALSNKKMNCINSVRLLLSFNSPFRFVSGACADKSKAELKTSKK